MLVDPGEREEEVIPDRLLRGLTPFALSLLLHCAVLSLSPALLPLIPVPDSDEETVTLELLNSIRKRIRRESPEVAGPSGQENTSLQEQLSNLAAAGAGPERIAAGSEVDLARIRTIRSAIYARWDAGTPPEQGRALVLLYIDEAGNLVRTWVRALQGEQGFQEYMRNFLASLELPDSEGDELWLECEFIVKN